VATGEPHRTPSEVMMTMNISTATNISQWCSMSTTSTCKAFSTTTKSTVSKATPCGINNTSSHLSTLLREIPTRTSQIFSTNAIDDLLDNDSKHRPHKTLSSFQDANKMTLQPQTLSGNDDDSFDYKLELAAITARCKRMQQQWLLLLALIDQNCVIKDDMQSSDRIPPAPSSPWPIDTMLANEALCHLIECPAPFEPSSIIHQSQRLLTDMKKQSQALCNLMAMSNKLLALMTCVGSKVDKLVAIQPPNPTPVPLPHPLTMTNTTIISIPAHEPELKKLLLPYTQYHNNLHTATSPRLIPLHLSWPISRSWNPIPYETGHHKTLSRPQLLWHIMDQGSCHPP